MKKINSLIMILLTFAAFNASAQVDLGCTAVNNPAMGDTVYAGIPVSPNYTRKNFGSALPANHPDQLYMVLSVDGDSIVSFTRNMTNPFASGADETVNGQAINFGAITPALSDGKHRFCVRTLIKGDTDPSNDTSCVNIYYSSTLPPADLAVTAVSVTDPTPVGIDFELGQSQLQVVTFTLQNAGSTAIQAGTRVAVELTVGTASNTLNLTLNRAIAASASINATASRASIAALVDFPTTVGNFDVCMAASYTGDANSSNDTSCTTYNMTANVTPAITSYTPVSAKCGETLTISGSNFSPTPASNTVEIRGVACKVLTATATQLTVEVPEMQASSGTLSVEVTVAGVVKRGEASRTFAYEGCTVSLAEINNKFGNVFYANNGLNILTTQAGAKNIQIVNMTGQIVFQEVRDLQENNVEVIDLSATPNGVYVVNIDGYSTTFVK